MASPNLSEIATTTLSSRTKKIRDNVTKNNAILMRLKQKGRIRTFSGGEKIYEEISYAENANAQWYSGAEQLAVAAQDVLTSAEFAIKQFGVAVTISGLEELQNSGPEQMIDLLAARIDNAEGTGANKISEGIYSDGTGSSSKTITGIDATMPADPTTGTYGGINRATAGNEFWRSQLVDVTLTAANVNAKMTDLWLKCIRGVDRPDLIAAGTTAFSFYLQYLQPLQRFSNADAAGLGFDTVKFMSADVFADGGVGGFADAEDMYFLNTKFLSYRPHKDRDMVPIGKKRQSVNQDVTVEILGWAGNVTCSGARFQGRLKGD